MCRSLESLCNKANMAFSKNSQWYHTTLDFQDTVLKSSGILLMTPSSSHRECNLNPYCDTVLHNLTLTYLLQVQPRAPSILTVVLQNTHPILSIVPFITRATSHSSWPVPNRKTVPSWRRTPKRISLPEENKADFAPIRGHEAKGNQKDHTQESFKMITGGITSNSCIHSPRVNEETDASYKEVD